MRRRALIVEAVDDGNSGLHQHGFARYAMVTLDCGHKERWSWYAAGDTPDGRPVRFLGGAVDSFPVEGQECTCYLCVSSGEELRPYPVSARRVMSWMRGGPSYFGCVWEAQMLLGLTDQEWYRDENFMALTKRGD